MKVYKRKASNPMKWILAAILFIAAMTFTLADVNGYPSPPDNSRPGDKDQLGSTTSNDGSLGSDDQPGDPKQNPGVPEPGTLILMAAGLGAFYIMRKCRKASAY